MRLAIILGLALAMLPTARAAAAEDIRMVDAHSQVDSGVSMEQVLSILDEAGISHAILSSLRGHSRARDIVETAKQQPGRITPSIGLKGHYARGEPSAFERVRKMASGQAFKALSEVMVLHEAKGKDGGVAPEIIVDFDAPLVREAIAIARARRWPLVVHIEFGFAYALNRLDAYMSGLERLTGQNRDIAIALTHMGQLNAANVRRLIQSYDNIYFLTSHANTVWIRSRRTDLSWTNLFDGDVLAPEWKALLLQHPDRFVLAFDSVYDGDWSDFYVEQTRLWKAALATLPSEAAHAIAHGNAERLWRLRASAPPQGAAGSAGGGRPSPAEAVRQMDSDGDGRVSAAEFPGPPRAFKAADANGDGFLSAEELSAFRQRRRGQ